MDSGTLQGGRPVTATNYTVRAGTLSGDFTLTVPGGGTFDKTADNNTDQLLIQGGADLVLDTPAAHDAGLICLSGASSRLLVNALLTVTEATHPIPFNCDGQILVAPTGELRNTATTDKNYGSPVDNDGIVRVEAGRINLNGNAAAAEDGQADGQFNVNPGAILAFNNPHSVSPIGDIVATGNGQVRITHNVTLADGASLTTNDLRQSGGTLTLQGNTAQALPSYTMDSGVLQGGRPVTATNYTVRAGTLSGDFTLTVPGGGTFDKTADNNTDQLLIQGGADLVLDTPAAHDAGLICLSGASSRLLVNALLTVTEATHPIPFNCDGQILVAPTGELRNTATTDKNYNSPVTNEGGTVSVMSGRMNAVLTQTAGTTSVPAGTILGGTRSLSGGSLNLAGTLFGLTTLTGVGTLTGNGTAANVTNSSGVVSPGNSAGTLTIDGDYVQGSGGTLEVEIGGTTPGTQFDLLAVSGAATLDGTVAYTQIGGFEPAFADEFQFLTSASRSGTFVAPPAGAPLPNGKAYGFDYPGGPSFGARLLLQAPSAPANQTPPSISSASSTLTCNAGAWSNSPSSFAFAWLRDGEVVAGAGSNQLAITGADATHTFVCRVSATNAGGTGGPVDSGQFAVPAEAPQNAVAPLITGTPAVGQVLGCDGGEWSGAPAPTLGFQWLADGAPIAGATASSYTITAADAGHALSCRVTATNAGGSASESTAAVNIPAPAAPTPTPTPTPTATPTPTPSPVEVLAQAPATQVAGAFGLPATRRCLSRRNFKIRLKEPKGIKIRRAVVRVAGKKAKVRRIRGRLVAQVDLRGFPKAKVVVSIQVTTSTRVKLNGKRTYKTCRPRA